jgi:hypothetical protein
MGRSERKCGPSQTPLDKVLTESDLPAFAVIPSPPRPFEAFVEMRESLARRVRRLRVSALYSGYDGGEGQKLGEGSDLLSSVIEKMGESIKDKTGWRKLDAIDIFSPTSIDPEILTFQESLLKACQRAGEEADLLEEEPPAYPISNLVSPLPCRVHHECSEKHAD